MSWLRFIGLICLLWLGVVPLARSEASTFAQLTEHPVTISYFQPVSGINDKILAIDDLSEIDRRDQWRPFYQSDVWVFFLADSSEFSVLPQEIVGITSQKGELPTSGITRYEVELSDGSLRLLLIVIMESYLDSEMEEYKCKIAHSIHWAITENSPPHSKELQENIEDDCIN